ncbi:MAG TPA: bifunctional UDP-N-acetylglucosamine diphosphorylase/glucosamine-1-phosphate N-acetyltransferase GlmU [Lichenihabitans sp.]|nr:bifunctional UDP-N-acetylglucosamine diphosphorylase/glucosamine-1-phosphate N-acetyltransferase GlmU [Lichenihabitans sp.]
MTAPRRCLCVILAAGEGTRMKSASPKVMHRLGGRTMLAHVMAAADAVGDRVAVVVGPGRDDVATEARKARADVEIFTQQERRGTAHAVLAARSAIEAGCDDLLVLYGDVPLVKPQTLLGMRAALAAGIEVVALGFEAADPHGYGRLLTQDGALLAIREHKDASEAERAVRLCNSGLMGLDGTRAIGLLDRIRSDNAQGEFYLTDAVEIARAEGGRCAAPVASEEEVMGINDRVQLAEAEAVLQARLRDAAMRAGATLIAPQTVFLSHDTRLGRDVVVEPHVVFGQGVTVEEGAVIHAFSHLEGAAVGPGASVGPYGRLRPGARLGQGAKVGNFVEVKSADIEAGAKVSHLTYIGDARVGAGANVGAGTVTCNYDGFGKYRTEIGAGAFIGSNSSLVAPVTVGDGAFVGSGSVITEDVPADALALGRGRQTVKDGWAAAFRHDRARKD